MESDEGMAAKDEQREEGEEGRKRIENWTVNSCHRFHVGVVN